jgi:hypothetical protein
MNTTAVMPLVATRSAPAPAVAPAAPAQAPAPRAPAPPPMPNKTGSLGAFGYRAELYGGDINKLNAALKQKVGVFAPSFSPEKNGGPQPPGAHVALPPEMGGGNIVIPGATPQQLKDYHGKALQYLPGLQLREGVPQQAPQKAPGRQGALLPEGAEHGA